MRKLCSDAVVDEGNAVQSVGAVVVHHESADDLRRCLTSLSAGGLVPTATVIVENSPSDEARRAAEELAVEFSARHLPMAGNVGFGAGCNRGAEALDGCDQIFFVNQDAEVSGDCLEKLQRALAADDCLAAINPLIVTQHRRVWFAAGLLQATLCRLTRPSFGKPLAELKPTSTEWLNGCALLVRSEAWRELGGFDERYFLYWEDVDLSVRATEAGWRIGTELAAEVTHHQGEGGDGLRNLNPVAVEHAVSSRLIFLRSRSTGIQWLVGGAYTAVNALRLLSLVARHNRSDLSASVLAVGSGLRRGLTA